MKTIQRIKDITPGTTLATGGIFAGMSQTFPTFITAEMEPLLGVYFYAQYNEKPISPVVKSLLNKDSQLDAQGIEKLHGLLSAFYKKQWESLFDTLSYEYDPISNYDMTETMEGDNTLVTYGKTVTSKSNNTLSRAGSDTLKTDRPSSQDNYINAFNTQNMVKTGGSSVESMGKDETVYNSSVDETGGASDATTGTDKTEHSYTLKRSGNIGVTTSQQMIQSQRDLLLWNFYESVLFPGIASFMTLPIY